jgi:hypothetical protein
MAKPIQKSIRRLGNRANPEPREMPRTSGSEPTGTRVHEGDLVRWGSHGPRSPAVAAGKATPDLHDGADGP